MKLKTRWIPVAVVVLLMVGCGAGRSRACTTSVATELPGRRITKRKLFATQGRRGR